MPKITISLEAESQEIITAGLDAFARASGYTDESEETKLQVAEKRLKAYFREIVTGYQMQEAMKLAMEQAQLNANTALDAITLTAIEE